MISDVLARILGVPGVRELSDDPTVREPLVA
jgi:hypothetical protein